MNMISNLSAPVTVELALTHVCNHRCIHCYNPYRLNYDQHSHRDLHDIETIISELRENNVLKVVVTGGEPLTNKELTLETIKHLKNANIDISLNTNLTLIDQNFIDHLKKIDDKISLFVSIPSLTSNSFNFITKNKEGYEKIKHGLELCLKNRITVGINIVVSKLTNYDYDSISKLLEKYPNIAHVSLSPVIPPVYDLNNPLFEVTDEDLISIKNTLLLLNKQFNISVGSSIPLPMCIVGADLYNIGHSSSCCAGRTDCTIDFQSGNILACSGFEENFGNIYVDGLKSSWKNMDKWRDTSLINHKCIECRYLPICSGECRAITKYSIYHNINPNVKLNFLETHINIDYSKKYTLNKNLKIRKEEFGVILFLKNGYLFASETVYSILKIMNKLNKFDMSDLSEYITIDDNFYKLFETLYISKYVVISNDDF